MRHWFTYYVLHDMPLHLAQQSGRGWLPDGSTVVTGLTVRLGQELYNTKLSLASQHGLLPSTMGSLLVPISWDMAPAWSSSAKWVC